MEAKEIVNIGLEHILLFGKLDDAFNFTLNEAVST